MGDGQYLRLGLLIEVYSLNRSSLILCVENLFQFSAPWGSKYRWIPDIQKHINEKKCSLPLLIRSDFTAMYFPQSILFSKKLTSCVGSLKKMSNYHHKKWSWSLKTIHRSSTVVTYFWKTWAHYKSQILICWVVICPLHSAVHHLNNRVQFCILIILFVPL